MSGHALHGGTFYKWTLDDFTGLNPNDNNGIIQFIRKTERN